MTALNGKVNAQIRAQVAGYLLKQRYTNGAYVKPGTPLFQLDSRIHCGRRSGDRGLEQAKGDLARTQANQVKTQQDVDR